MSARRLTAALGFAALALPFAAVLAQAQERATAEPQVRLFCQLADNEPNCRAGVVAADLDGFLPAALAAPSPTYPRALANQNIEGWVVVQFTITEEGMVQNSTVVTADPAGTQFDEAALAAVGRYRFEPPMLDGQPVAVHNIAVRINFSQD